MILILLPRPLLLGPILDDESLPLAKNFFLEHEQWWINPPLTFPLVPLKAITDDEVLPGAKNFALEHEAWFINATQTFLTNKPPITDTDERVPFVAPSGVEDDLWMRLITWPVVPPFPAILDDEILPSAKNFFLDEDLWWQAQREQIPLPPLQAVTDDEILALLFLDEDLWWIPSYRGSTVPLQAITDEEVLPGARNFALDEDLWTVGTMALWRLPLVPSTTDEDVWPTTPTGFLGDEDLWLRVTIWPTLPPCPAFLDDEVLPGAKNFALEEDVYLASLAFSQSIIRQAITELDELPFGAAPSIVEEETWARLAPIAQTWSVCLPPADHDALPLMGFDEEPWITTPLRGFAPVPQPILDEMAVVPTMVDDDTWRPQVVASIRYAASPIWDAELTNTSGVRLVAVFTVRCARTLPVMVACAQTKPVTVRMTKTINQTLLL